MTTVADYVLARLRDWGIHRIFGYPGDGINAFLGALDRSDHGPEFIQTRHEEMAAFMASAHAKFTGEVGCCLATSGGGAPLCTWPRRWTWGYKAIEAARTRSGRSDGRRLTHTRPAPSPGLWPVPSRALWWPACWHFDVT